MKRILSIDGGGIRGIVPGQILVNLEQKIKTISGNPDARLADYFDFFAGTSTGGILTCIYLFPDDEQPGRAKFSAQQAVELYTTYGNDIFHIPFFKRIESLGGLRDEKFPASQLETLLKNYFADHEISQLLKPCLITSYNIEARRAQFLTQHDAILKGDSYNYKVRDVARATSAAPTYFEPALIKSKSGESYPLVDGGVFANDPTLCAFSELRGSVGNPTAKDMFILSLGTGSTKQPYPYSKMKTSGLLEWAQPVIDIMMSGSSETTSFHLKNMFAAENVSANYLRIEPKQLNHEQSEMDNASQENILSLVELGQTTAEQFDEQLQHAAEIICAATPDHVTFT